MHRERHIGGLAALVVLEAAALPALHRMGSLPWMQVPWDRLRMWLDLAPPEDVLAASLRIIALGVAYWIVVSTAAYALARLTRIPGLIKATTATTLPSIRRVIDRAIAVTVTAAALAVPVIPAIAGATEPPEPIVYEISDRGVPIPLDPVPVDDSTVVVPPGVAGPGYTPSPAGNAPNGTEGEVEMLYEIVEGDNLWTVSGHHLRRRFPDRTVAADEIAAYWRQVIEVNTPALRSGDANLIYPGEQIVLPPADRPGNT